MNHRFNRHSSHGLFGQRRHHSPARPLWKNLGSCEIAGSVCEWTIHLAIRPEVAGLRSIRWRGEEQDEEVIGPDDLLNLFAFSGIEAVEEFARQNRVA